MIENLKNKLAAKLNNNSILEDKRGLQLISIITILGFALLFIVLPDFWFVYLLLGLALILFVERKFRNKSLSKDEQEKAIVQLKDDLKNKRMSDEGLYKLADGDKSTRLTIAQGLSENFAQFSTSAKVIEKFSEDKDENVRDAALYVFRQNLFKFLNPSDVFEKFLKAGNYSNYSCDYAMKLIRIMKDNFEKISPDAIEHAIINIAKSDLIRDVRLANSILGNAQGTECLIDVKEELAKFIDINFNRIGKGKSYAMNLLAEDTLKIEAENEDRYVSFIVNVANCIGKNYIDVENAQKFVERFSRSMNGDIGRAVALTVDKNYRNIKILNVILENLTYGQSDEAKAIVRKNLRKDM